MRQTHREADLEGDDIEDEDRRLREEEDSEEKPRGRGRGRGKGNKGRGKGKQPKPKGKAKAKAKGKKCGQQEEDANNEEEDAEEADKPGDDEPEEMEKEAEETRLTKEEVRERLLRELARLEETWHDRERVEATKGKRVARAAAPRQVPKKADDDEMKEDAENYDSKKKAATRKRTPEREEEVEAKRARGSPKQLPKDKGVKGPEKVTAEKRNAKRPPSKTEKIAANTETKEGEKLVSENVRQNLKRSYEKWSHKKPADANQASASSAAVPKAKQRSKGKGLPVNRTLDFEKVANEDEKEAIEGKKKKMKVAEKEDSAKQTAFESFMMFYAHMCMHVCACTM